MAPRLGERAPVWRRCLGTHGDSAHHLRRTEKIIRRLFRSLGRRFGGPEWSVFRRVVLRMRISVGRIVPTNDPSALVATRCAITQCAVAQQFRLPPTETGYPAETIYMHPYLVGVLSAISIVEHWLVVLRALAERRTDPRGAAAQYAYESLDRAFALVRALRPTRSPCALLEDAERNAFAIRHGEPLTYLFAPEHEH